MKNLKILVGVLLMSTISCTITDDNTDPNNPNGDQVNAGAIYPGMITQSHKNLVAVNARVAGIVVQHYDGLDAQQLAYDQYNITESDTDDYWDGGLYGGGAMTDCFSIINGNEGEVAALAKLYMAANLGMTTSMWGDAPYSDAFTGDQGNFTPTYDDQETLYTTIQTLLDEAIADGVASGVGEFAGAGSTGADWEKTAHALKARYFLHLTKRQGNAAAASALSEAQMAFDSNDEAPVFVFSNPVQNANPLFGFESQRPATLGIATTLTNRMTGDPRLPFYTTNGTNFANADGLFWGQPDSPTPLISYWEVKFIEAEAIVRTGGSDADALTAMQEAVEANMQFIGVAQADIDAYTAGLAISGTTEDKIEAIVTEKYKAFYGNSSIEAWNDFRRTGYPDLTPSPDAVASVNPSLVVPRRFLYPISERQTNRENYEAAINAQGGHLLDVDIWAFE
ncbi:SusD/RagB family nutrient-binding outer membrane lipoprotein [Nonlabens xiamenensis]|uniref:SusD/RagB family nutrient-binding outer membrane lipoprotein n=1 Tax=Nonlabens xiamenensis TaxID=2341043 RepID=UPI000F614445|nr:SusD/RagB family nutrient-binding outer membrane lipoprotein [Nonlabens xiamenensis]